jgi:hypothetical protein
LPENSRTAPGGNDAEREIVIEIVFHAPNTLVDSEIVLKPFKAKALPDAWTGGKSSTTLKYAGIAGQGG